MYRLVFSVGFLLSTVFLASAQQRVTAAIDTTAATEAVAEDAAADQTGVADFKAGATGYEDATLPVLAMGSLGETKAGAPNFVSLSLAHAIFYQLDDVKLTIMAQGTEFVDGGEAPTDVAPDTTPYFEVIEDDDKIDGAQLTFVRFGVSYTLRLSCERQDDERCLEDGFLMGIHDALIVVEDGV